MKTRQTPEGVKPAAVESNKDRGEVAALGERVTRVRLRADPTVLVLSRWFCRGRKSGRDSTLAEAVRPPNRSACFGHRNGPPHAPIGHDDRPGRRLQRSAAHFQSVGDLRHYSSSPTRIRKPLTTLV